MQFAFLMQIWHFPRSHIDRGFFTNTGIVPVSFQGVQAKFAFRTTFWRGVGLSSSLELSMVLGAGQVWVCSYTPPVQRLFSPVNKRVTSLWLHVSEYFWLLSVRLHRTPMASIQPSLPGSPLFCWGILTLTLVTAVKPGEVWSGRPEPQRCFVIGFLH